MRRRSGLLQWLVDAEPPGLGIDLRSNEVAVVRLSQRRKAPELDLGLTFPLPEGLVRFSMLEPNVGDEDAFRKALESILLRAGVAGGKRIALTLPDPVCRIAVTELPEAPRSREELTELLKFRMKKSLPFDVDQARIAYERLPRKEPTFLTGVMHEAVIGQYEDAFSALGFHLGLVLPASVSLLQLLRSVARTEVSPGADYFFVNVEREYFSVSLVRDRDMPVLVRTLGRRATEDGGALYTEDDLLQEIIPTAIYYQEKLSAGSLERVYYRSLRPDLIHLREILESPFEAPTEPFNLMKAVGVARSLSLDAALADAVGAAAGAAVGKAA